ncbi:MAG: 23S rRNA (adenine(2503)-C(2))-methyltransferase RlmN [Solirubrobacterales bacterium]|nr:23S rRNA (adenine(2503)-C(2))-methyltransferase RlmN [Solirubrobacterales bacterium]
MDLESLEETMAGLGQPSYRTGQVWEWLARGAGSFEEMTNLPSGLRGELTEKLPISTLAVDASAKSVDGTEKALFMTADNRPVEAVLMRYRDGRRSLCLSSQSGCPLTCTFCATGTMKFGRNLTESEILDQALHFRRIEPVNHTVFMGMGEPMMNLDNVLAVCERLPAIGIANSHTTVSTVGWLPGIVRMTNEGPAVRLALSLHAPNDRLRSEIMPVNDRYPMEEVVAACREWRHTRKRKVFIEYLMLDGVNDSVEIAHELADLLLPKNDFKVNLIPYNPSGTGYQGSPRAVIDRFRETLITRGVHATVRLTRGRDIDAACGQLAAKAANGG